MASSPIIFLILATTAIFGLIGAPPCAAHNIFYNTGLLSPGQSIVSNSGVYELTMQIDCNLVLYECNPSKCKSSRSPIWATGTTGGGIRCALDVQSDGKLVIFNERDDLWTSGKSGENGKYALVLQEDGNVVVYGPALWATRTGKGALGAVTVVAHNSTANSNATASAAEQLKMSVA